MRAVQLRADFLEIGKCQPNVKYGHGNIKLSSLIWKSILHEMGYELCLHEYCVYTVGINIEIYWTLTYDHCLTKANFSLPQNIIFWLKQARNSIRVPRNVVISSIYKIASNQLDHQRIQYPRPTHVVTWQTRCSRLNDVIVCIYYTGWIYTEYKYIIQYPSIDHYIYNR